MIARLPVLLPAALLMLVSVLATGTGAYADDGIGDRIEFSGRLSTETRLYPASAAHPGQRSHASGFAAEVTAYMEDDEGRSITVTPFYRYDAGDPDRTHADLREAYLLLYGDVGDDEWELRLGVDRVFWGVVESRSLVDIVNQTDLVEHPNEKTKLGQPMVHLTWSGDWGALELFGLTGHRERTFPGRHGRLRPEFVMDPKRTSYESAAEEWHLDLAGRYSGSFGPVDVGLSVFDGTSREPTLLPTPTLDGSEIVLAPHYEQIRQFGLDTQLTTGPWLLKLEAIHRAGAQNTRFDPISGKVRGRGLCGLHRGRRIHDQCPVGVGRRSEPDRRMGSRRARPLGDQRIRERHPPCRAPRAERRTELRILRQRSELPRQRQPRPERRIQAPPLGQLVLARGGLRLCGDRRGRRRIRRAARQLYRGEPGLRLLNRTGVRRPGERPPSGPCRAGLRAEADWAHRVRNIADVRAGRGRGAPMCRAPPARRAAPEPAHAARRRSPSAVAPSRRGGISPAPPSRPRAWLSASNASSTISRVTSPERLRP